MKRLSRMTVISAIGALLLGFGACSSSDEGQQEEVVSVDDQQQQQEQYQDSDSIDAALAETLASVDQEADQTADELYGEGEDVLANELESTTEELETVSDEPETSEEAFSVVEDAPVETDVASDYSEPVPQASETTNFSSEGTFQYTVKKGDWLCKILKNVYGSDNGWRQVAQANGLQNPDLIFPGQKLTLELTNEQSKSFADAYAQADFSDVQQTENGSYELEVAPGDSLSKIAQKVFGDYSAWEKIYNSNQGQISNPNMIFVGQKLVIPAGEAVAH